MQNMLVTWNEKCHHGWRSDGEEEEEEGDDDDDDDDDVVVV